MITRGQARILADGLQPLTPVGQLPFRVSKRKAFAAPKKVIADTKRSKVSETSSESKLVPDDAPDLLAVKSEIPLITAAVQAPVAAIPTTQAPFKYDEALKVLCKADPALKTIIDTAEKPCQIFESSPNKVTKLNAFAALVSAIIYQQLSGKAASTILKRFLTLFKEDLDPESVSRRMEWFPTPHEVRATDRSILTGVGLSGRKAEYVHALSDRFIDGSISTERLSQMEDEEISTLLCSVKGIGQWTVDMFLMFDLKRPNILPVGDLGVRKGMSKHFKMKGDTRKQKAGGGVYLPTPEEMRTAAQCWEPYRSIGAYYMWQLLDIKTVGDAK
ncbi:DNA glycosylase [Phlyctochytrium arcticum]|nr:DNA glycosylase [Phlyctochytrium arcticum]